MEKTCGNCGHWHHMKNDCGACLESYSGALSQEVTITGRSESCLIVPNSWTPKTTNTLEQRYQQLAEVARELYKAVEPMHESCNEDTCLALIDEGWPSDACLYDFRKRLEELGVEL